MKPEFHSDKVTDFYKENMQKKKKKTHWLTILVQFIYLTLIQGKTTSFASRGYSI